MRLLYEYLFLSSRTLLSISIPPSLNVSLQQLLSEVFSDAGPTPCFLPSSLCWAPQCPEWSRGPFTNYLSKYISGDSLQSPWNPFLYSEKPWLLSLGIAFARKALSLPDFILSALIRLILTQPVSPSACHLPGAAFHAHPVAIPSHVPPQVPSHLCLHWVTTFHCCDCLPGLPTRFISWRGRHCDHEVPI